MNRQLARLALAEAIAASLPAEDRSLGVHYGVSNEDAADGHLRIFVTDDWGNESHTFKVVAL